MVPVKSTSEAARAERMAGRLHTRRRPGPRSAHVCDGTRGSLRCGTTLRAERGNGLGCATLRAVVRSGAFVTGLLVTSALCVSRGAVADVDLGDQGQPIRTSNYTIDLYEGPVLAGARVVGLGGAYVPLAQGVAGYAFNPAAVAQRTPWSVDWFDWELDGGLTFGSSISGFDFDNSGDAGFTDSAALFVNGGGGLQFGAVGVGAYIDVQQYSVGSLADDQGDLDVNVIRALLVAGYSLFHGQLSIGLGLSANQVGLTDPDVDSGNADIANVAGFAGHLGVTWAPAVLPLRIGASLRLSPQASFDESKPKGAEEDAEGNFVSRGYYLPRTISLPSEVQVGVAWQFFRPLNFYWVNPKLERWSAENIARRDIDAERKRRDEQRRVALEGAAVAGRDGDALEERLDASEQRARHAEDEVLSRARAVDRLRRRLPYKSMPREKLLVSAALKVTTITTNGVGLESFLTQVVARSGEDVSWSPRLGVESEVWPRYLVLRAGTYYEPTRFRAPADARIHGTGGLDIRIPIEWSVFGLFDDDNTFRVGGAVDLSARYFGWGVSAGVWR